MERFGGPADDQGYEQNADGNLARTPRPHGLQFVGRLLPCGRRVLEFGRMQPIQKPRQQAHTHQPRQPTA
jgi:hypothetical protein